MFGNFGETTLLLAALVLFSSCGDSQNSQHLSFKSSSIVGGKISNKVEDNNIVLLGGGHSSSVCTGTLVHPRVVITAAHCQNAATEVKVGLYGERASSYRIKRFVAHPFYNEKHHVFDLAILILEKAVKLEGMTPVSLLNGEEVEKLSQEVVSGESHGYGNTDFEKSLSGERMRRKVSFDKVVSKGLMLAFGNSSKNVAPGDSGGPLFLHDGERRVFAGVHSYISRPKGGQWTGYAAKLEKRSECFFKFFSPFKIFPGESNHCAQWDSRFDSVGGDWSKNSSYNSVVAKMKEKGFPISIQGLGWEISETGMVSGNGCRGSWSPWWEKGRNNVVFKINCGQKESLFSARLSLFRKKLKLKRE